MERTFDVGQTVGLRADRSRQGMIAAVLPPTSGMPRYSVFHSVGEMRTYDQDQLVPVEVSSGGSMEDALAKGRWLPPRVFLSRLTAARLSHDNVDNLYSAQAARIQFIPFQLKPLLRFLRSDQPRLLIADEVGVGKTIEAGLILKELETRQQVENVLIVCPRALVSKWRAEMRRFDEEFRVLNASDLQYCLREAHNDGVWPPEYGRAIVHLELLRMGAYLDGVDGRLPRPGLRTLDPLPKFDLLILDEAHHARTPASNSYEAVRLLAESSEAAVFLSATPVHVGAQNLFALLNLLRPDRFPDLDSFNEMLAPNAYISEAMRLVRASHGDTWQEEVAACLARALETSWGAAALRHDPRATYWWGRLLQDSLTDTERIAFLRDLEEMHSLHEVMNRTRRRDIGAFTVRDPHTIAVSFTSQAEIFYRALVDLRRDLLSLEHNPLVARLITDTLERQAASCLPALVPLLERFLRTDSINLGELTDAWEDEVPGNLTVSPCPRKRAEELRMLARDLPEDDPKLDRLLEIVRQAMVVGGPGKTLVFSYFLHTLDYLEKKLSALGLRVGLVSGRLEDEVRERLRDRFRLPRTDPNALDVLLSSEVGCEGLDYEFCDRLVNYDIPWNPMRIEQRIGRIDRFGQKADKVLIFNFVTPGTVEERIFFRCFDRLGIFRNAVGDLEEVLGDMTSELNRAVFDPALTPGQAEEKARQVADNAIREMEEQRRLEDEGGGLMGVTGAYLQEVDDLLAQGTLISPDDLRTMIATFLADPQIDGRIMPDTHIPHVYRLILRKDARAEIFERMRLGRFPGRTARLFMNWLQGTDAQMLHTYDQKTAVERREMPFITPVHPLAKLAINYWTVRQEPLIARLTVEDLSVPEGRYLFLAELWESVAVRPDARLAGRAYSLDRGEIDPLVSEMLISLLARAQGEAQTGAAIDGLRATIEALDASLYEARTAVLADLRERNTLVVERQVASLDAYYQNRLRRLNCDLETMNDDRILRMKTAEKTRVARDYDEKRKHLLERREADITTQRVAAGILEVCHAK